MPLAQESWRQRRSETGPFLKEQTGKSYLIDILALTHLGLGDQIRRLGSVGSGDDRDPYQKDVLLSVPI